MLRPRNSFLAAALMGTAIFGLSGCKGFTHKITTGAKTTTIASATDTFCSDLKDVSTSLIEVQGLDSNRSSKADVTEAANDLQESMNATASSASDLQKLMKAKPGSAKEPDQADARAVQGAIDYLKETVKNLPSGQGIQQDMTQLQSPVQAIAGSITQSFNALGCKA